MTAYGQTDPIDCPACGRLNDGWALSSTGDAELPVASRCAAPEPGDLAVCWHCGALNAFDRTPLGVLTLRAATAAELAEAKTDAGVRHTLAQRELAPDPITSARWALRAHQAETN